MSSYIPKRPGVSTAMKHGATVYVRDGRIHKHGLFGSGLVDAVAGNPRAEEAARSYHARTRNGLLLAMPAALCTGFALGATTDGYEPLMRPALYTMVGCLLVMAVGTGIVISGVPYRHNAINMFNDDLSTANITMPGRPARKPGKEETVTPAAKKGTENP